MSITADVVHEPDKSWLPERGDYITADVVHEPDKSWLPERGTILQPM